MVSRYPAKGRAERKPCPKCGQPMRYGEELRTALGVHRKVMYCPELHVFPAGEFGEDSAT